MDNIKYIIVDPVSRKDGGITTYTNAMYFLLDKVAFIDCEVISLESISVGCNIESYLENRLSKLVGLSLIHI